ncbi:MAG TPA: exodeoxyribonuclease VII large subunit, partial [Abditibacteriaceae bacterium]|nr:exodeoxyribonuclease VII large subunit [Abditibacteriaceae bacterium]
DNGALSVGELAWQIKRVLESDAILCDIAVEGEISGFKAYSSGHCYLTLKDDAAQVRAVIWRKSVANLSFRPKDGDRVVALGHVEFYPQRGEVSFIVDNLRFAGQGALFEAFERLKTELAADGLFADSRKKPIPVLPKRIGLITSASGAVIQDMLSILRRRWPLAHVLFIPSAVQGFGAAEDLVRALNWAAAVDDLDVVIMGRGGGSAEDLWAFNDEQLARTAAEFPVPLISAVGHETDWTILDLVADLRAPTPSAAAELVVPNQREVRLGVQSLRQRIANAVSGEVQMARHRLEGLRARRVLTHPTERLQQLRERVQARRTQVREIARQRVRIEAQNVKTRRAQLAALDPNRVLERGYALITERQSGRLISSVTQVREPDLIIALRDGQLNAKLQPGNESSA